MTKKTTAENEHLRQELAEIEFLLPQFESLFTALENSLKQYETTVATGEREARQKLQNLSRQMELTQQRLQRAKVLV